jgi:hypothetical protein
LNAPFVHVSTLLSRNAVLVWFWDCASLNSLRALSYLNEWDRRYAPLGLEVVGIHSPQFDFGHRRPVVEQALARLGIRFPVALDSSFEVWRLYGNEVWPALYLADRRGLLRWYHFGEGAYSETEHAIHEVLREIEVDVELPQPLEPLRETDRPHALVHVPTPHRYLEEDRAAREVHPGEELVVRYQGATAAAVLDGRGPVEVLVDGRALGAIELDGPRLYEVAQSEVHAERELRLRFRCEALAYAFSFAAGPASSPSSDA